ncbi:MAG: D-lyxose/D-mannose family sugar isomerase [Phycisphaeraceae bacterium]
MKRSEINQILRQAQVFLDEHRFVLPPLSKWSPDDWQSKGSECRRIVEQQMGWDITDFGSGDFERVGLFLFTMRNGVAAETDLPGAKVYAEKVLLVRDGQITPTHFHWQKMEDIINRGGGELVLELWNSHGDRELSDSEVLVVCDGVQRSLPAGRPLVLQPGDSVTLPQRLWHKFYGRGGTVLVGEVSRVNDDRTDNNFHEPIGRFPTIQEDEPPVHLLVGDYGRYYRF